MCENIANTNTLDVEKSINIIIKNPELKARIDKLYQSRFKNSCNLFLKQDNSFIKLYQLIKTQNYNR